MPMDKAPDCGERDELVEGATRSRARAAERGARAAHLTAAHAAAAHRTRRMKGAQPNAALIEPKDGKEEGRT